MVSLRFLICKKNIFQSMVDLYMSFPSKKQLNCMSFHFFSSQFLKLLPKNASGGKKPAAKQTFCQRSGAYHFSMVIWLHTFFQRSSQPWNLQPSKKSLIASSNVWLGCTHLPDPFSKGVWECQVWTGKGQTPSNQHSFMMSGSSSKSASKPSFLQRLSEDLLPFCKGFQKICIFSSHHLPFPKPPFGKGPAGFSQDHLTFSQRSCFSANALIPFDKGYASNTPSVCRMKSFLVSSRCIRILYFRATFCVILVLLTPKDTL